MGRGREVGLVIVACELGRAGAGEEREVARGVAERGEVGAVRDECWPGE